jgi:antitoxin component of RelBE/YafQ-DinJ toxin-antitoxin module
MKEGNDKLTISVDTIIKDRFKDVCDKEGLKIGKQIELFMLNELKKRGVDLSDKKE